VRPLARAPFSLGLILAVVAGACASAALDDATSGLDGNQQLLVVGGADLTEGGRQTLIDNWNQQPGAPLGADLVELPRAADGQRSELIGALQSGAAEYDVLILDTIWIPEFAEAGLIQPLDGELLAPDFVVGAEEAGEWDGDTYGVPLNVDAGLLYYRTDLLREQGVTPEQLQDAGSVAALLEELDTHPDHPAYITQLRSYEGLTVNALEALWTTGEEGDELVGDDGGWEGDEDELQEGLASLETLEQGPDGDGKVSSLSFEANETESLDEFTDDDGGGTAMMRGWPYAYTQLPAGDDYDYGVTELPGVATLGGQSLALAATTTDEEAEAAEELIKFITQEESQQDLLRAGFAPALRDAYQLPKQRDSELCAAPLRVPGPEPVGEVDEDMPSEDFRTLLWCAVREAQPRPETEYYEAFSQTLRREAYRMLTDARVTADDAAECLNELLPQALRGERPEQPSEGDPCYYE
jgi:multiple sugar transport system substrate-binding protein